MTSQTLALAAPAAPPPRAVRFWDRIADGYAKKPVGDEAAYRHKLTRTQDYLRPEMTVLEIGCGTGSVALEHAPHVAEIRATDLSGRMVEIAREKAAAAGVTNIRFEQAGLDDLVVAPGSVDVVLAMNVLHLLDDRDAALAKIHRMLKPGGLLISTTPCIRDFLAVFALVAPLGRWLGLLPLVRVFTARALVESVTGQGFTLTERWQPARNKGLFLVARKEA